MDLINKLRGIATEANDYAVETEDVIYIKDSNGQLTLMEGIANDNSTEGQ